MLTSRDEAHAIAPASLLERVRDTFLAPGRLFRGFDDRPPWVDALGLATFIGAVAVAAEPAQFYLDQMENPVNRRGVPVELTSGPEQIVLWGRVMAVLSAILGHPTLAFGAAGLLLLAFGRMGKGGGTFRQYLAISSHGLLIVSLGMLLTNVMRLIAGAPSLLPTAGALSGMGTASTLGATLHALNLFTLWALAVMGIGTAAIARGVTNALAIGLMWGGYFLIAVTGAILFGG